jgi:hypothetical protein
VRGWREKGRGVRRERSQEEEEEWKRKKLEVSQLGAKPPSFSVRVTRLVKKGTVAVNKHAFATLSPVFFCDCGVDVKRGPLRKLSLSEIVARVKGTEGAKMRPIAAEHGSE